MGKFYVPTDGVESWRMLLADPARHWKTAYSARSLAHCWEDARGFPAELKSLCRGTALNGIEFLLGIPEHQVPLPGGSTKSQNDVFVLAKAGRDLVSMTIEGKVDETFGPTLGDWFVNTSQGKITRLNYLKKNIGLAGQHIESSIRYQLIHRTASAVIEAQRFHARYAVMVVHSFNQVNNWFEDFARFVELYGKTAKVGELVHATDIDDVQLYLGWAKGAERYLRK